MAESSAAPGQHGHQRTGNAVPGAIDHANQETLVVGAENVEITSHHVARSPKHEVLRPQGVLQLLVGLRVARWIRLA